MNPPSCVGGVSWHTGQNPWIDGDNNMVTGQIISQEADCGGCCFTGSSPHLPIFQPPLPSFSSLGAWQHPSRWRVYFCFCLFTYSCIQLFRASQGLSFHHRMQIATAANPLSSLPCRHPTSLSVSPSLLQFLWAVEDQACSDQAGLAPTHSYPMLHTCQTQWSVCLPAPPQSWRHAGTGVKF